MLGLPSTLIAYFTLWIVSIFCFAGILPIFENLYPLLTAALLFATVTLKNLQSTASPTQEAALSKQNLLMPAALLGLLLLFLFQLLALPDLVLKVLSPWSFDNTLGFLHRSRIVGQNAYPISADPSSTLASIKLYLGFVFLLCSALLLPKSHKIKEKSSFLFIYGCLFIAVLGMLNLFSGSEKVLWIFSKGHTFFGPYLNKNHAGALISVGAILCFSLLFSHSLKRRKPFLINIFVFLFLTILFIGSRAALLTTVLGCAFHTCFQRKLVSKRALYLLLAGFAIIAALSLFWKAAVFSRLISNTEYRFSFWSYAMELWRQSPFFGTGLGSFASISPRFVGVKKWVHPEHVENEYLELLSTCGLVGAALVGFLLYRWVRTSISTYAEATVPTLSKGFALAFLAFLLHAFFVFHAPVPAQHFLLAYLVYGIAPESGFLFSSRSRMFFAVVCLGAGLLCSSHSFLSTTTSNRLETTVVEILPAQFSTPKNHQAMLFVQQDRYEQLKQFFIKHPYDTNHLYEYAKLELVFGNPSRALVLAKEALHRSPLDLSKRMAMTALFAQKGYFSEAESWSEELLGGKSPLSIHIRSKINLDLAYAAMLSGENQKALSFVEQAKSIKFQNWEAFLYSGFLEKDFSLPFMNSWKAFKLEGLSSAAWDHRFYSLIHAYRVDPFPVLGNLAYVRPDIGNLLLPGDALPIWPKDIPEAKLQIQGDPSNYHWDGETLSINVSNHNSSIDRIYLPIEILPREGLGIRMVLRSSRRLENQMIYTSEGKNHLSQDEPRKLNEDRWELTLSSLENKLTEIGFTPLEKNGSYSIESIEIFVKSGG